MTLDGTVVRCLSGVISFFITQNFAKGAVVLINSGLTVEPVCAILLLELEFCPEPLIVREFTWTFPTLFIFPLVAYRIWRPSFVFAISTGNNGSDYFCVNGVEFLCTPIDNNLFAYTYTQRDSKCVLTGNGQYARITYCTQNGLNGIIKIEASVKGDKKTVDDSLS